VEPSVFQGQIVEGRGFPFGENLRSKRLTSEPFSLEVRAIPAAARRPWLPSREVKLVEEWPTDPPILRVGEPVTRTLTLTADGIAAAQLPSLAATLPDGLKQYSDQPVIRNQTRADGLTGLRQEKIAIVPSRAGRLQLPALEIPWWNTETGQQEVARIPSRSIEVGAASDAQPAAPSLPAAPELSETVVPAPEAPPEDTAGFWPWLSFALLVAWLGTALLWWRQRHQRGVQAETHSSPGEAEQPVYEIPKLRRACQQNDAGACKSALLGLARQRWPEQSPASLGALAGRVDAAFAEAIDQLNRALYGRETIDWDGDRLLREAEHWLKSNPVTAVSPPPPIPPLHPQRD
jgi:hypothetical protein